MARLPKQLPRGGLAATVLTVLAVAVSLVGAQVSAADDSLTAAPSPLLPPTDVQAHCAGAGGGTTAGYPDASAAQAEDLFTEHFPCILDQLAADPPGSQTDPSAAGSDPSTPPLPLRAADGTPVDLTLKPSGAGYQPANPIVPLTLPGALGAEVALGDRGIALDLGASDPGAAPAASAAPLSGQGLFYADAAPATDVMLAPISQGLESTYQLRGPESPESLQINLQLPAGAGLQSAVDGGAQVVQGGQPVASFYRPIAVDANGNPVAATMTVSGSSLGIDVPHSDPNTAYPIAVTATAGSFVPAAATQAATVVPSMDGVAPSAPTHDINGVLTTEGQQTANLGAKVVRFSLPWCDLERTQGVYQQGELQRAVNFVYFAHQTSPALMALISLQTSAPVFASSHDHHFPCALQQDPPDNGGASIASGYTSNYGLALRKVAWCLNGDSQCNDNVVDANGNPATVAMHGAMLDNGWVYGLEAGNEVNISTYWQTCNNRDSFGNCDGTITRAAANNYWNALAAATFAVHHYRAGVRVSSAGLSYGDPDGHGFGDSKVDGTTYLDQVLSNGDSGADAYSIHPYGKGLHPDIVYSNGVWMNNDVIQDTGWTRVLLISYGYGYTKPIWITEVGVDADYNDNDLVPNTEESQQFYDLYYTWENSIKAICSSDNVPLASFYTFKDPNTYGTGQRYYAGFAKIAPDHTTVDYSKPAYFWFNLEQYFTFNTCTG
jgi:hypothetical protein